MLQRTHNCHVQNDGSVSDASRLLDLGGLAVDRVELDTFGGRVVHLVTADESASACPGCGVFSVSVKALVCTRPRDIPYGTRVLRLMWHKRRWRCKKQLCPRASFTESLPAVRARSRLTTPVADRARRCNRAAGPGRLGIGRPLRSRLVHRARRVRRAREGPAGGAAAAGQGLGPVSAPLRSTGGELWRQCDIGAGQSGAWCALENRCGVIPTVGSNPTPSAGEICPSSGHVVAP